MSKNEVAARAVDHRPIDVDAEIAAAAAIFSSARPPFWLDESSIDHTNTSSYVGRNGSAPTGARDELGDLGLGVRRAAGGAAGGRHRAGSLQRPDRRGPAAR